MDLPAELRIPREGLINIKNRDKKCFLWCQRISKIDKQIAKQLNYNGIGIPVQEKDFNRIEMMNNICINVFGYENKVFFPIYVSDQSFKTQWIYCCLKMMIILIMCASKILTNLHFTKQKIKTKIGFVKVVYSVLVGKVC